MSKNPEKYTNDMTATDAAYEETNDILKTIQEVKMEMEKLSQAKGE